METMDLLAFIRNTYGLAVALQTNLAGVKLDKKEHTGITALADTLEQNLYNINVEVEELLNLH
jgi:hypothetical protein